uniref:Ovule protein n=1 Tax=Brugia timori TaxID=42155 RepID=A0A0R3QYS1_9BILA
LDLPLINLETFPISFQTHLTQLFSFSLPSYLQFLLSFSTVICFCGLFYFIGLNPLDPYIILAN